MEAKIAILSLSLGALLSPFQVLSTVLLLVAVSIVTDYVTGMLAAGIQGRLSSSVGFKGLVKKMSYGVLIGVAMVLDLTILHALPTIGLEYSFLDGILITSITSVWIIINEMISVLENLGDIGVPLPPFIAKVLEKLKSSLDDKTN